MLNKNNSTCKIVAIFTMLIMLFCLGGTIAEIVISSKTSTPEMQMPPDTPLPPIEDNIPESDKNENGNDDTILATPLQPAKQMLAMVRAKVNGLQVRANPKSNSTSLGYIDKDDLIAYKGKENGWYITTYKNQTAYVSASSSLTEIVRFEMQKQAIDKILQVGLMLLGTKYVYGAQRFHWGNGILNSAFSIRAFDCSSFTQYIYFKSNNVLLDTTSRAQSVQGKTVTNGNLQVGDVMFFTNSSRYYLTGIERIGHVGIYFGENYILHTASDYAVVEPISATRWKYFIHAKRFV